MTKRHKRQNPERVGRDQNVSRRAAAEESPFTSTISVVILILALLGMVLTAYLTYTASFETHPAFCGKDSGCDLVQSSRWATFLGMPMALWGLLTYAVLAGLALQARTRPTRRTPLLFVAVCGFSISAYLTVVSVVEIEATCPYCLASFGLITAIMGLSLVHRPPEWSTSLKEAAVVAVLIVGGLHLHYSGVFDEAAGPEDPQLKALAIHLSDVGAKFYGAYWCPRCQEQKALFKASAKRLPYVECSSGGRGSSLTAPCVANDVRSYPTWIINDRRLTGVRIPRTLARASRFPWKE